VTEDFVQWPYPKKILGCATARLIPGKQCGAKKWMVCNQGCSADEKGVGTHPKKSPFQSHFKIKREKGVGAPFPRVPAPLHPCVQ